MERWSCIRHFVKNDGGSSNDSEVSRVILVQGKIKRSIILFNIIVFYLILAPATASPCNGPQDTAVIVNEPDAT